MTDDFVDIVAWIVEIAYRAACDWTTYTPAAIGSAWFESTHIADGFLMVNDDRWAPLEDLDFEFAATISMQVFPLGSGRADSNRRPPSPEDGALPS